LRNGADAVVPVVPIHDTVRQVDQDGHLAGLVDRSSLVAIQTPQGFRRAALVQAHADAPAAAATDDAGLIERQGGEIVAVPGSDDSFKITTPGDLARAAAVAALA
jgi:2-C-methyl-D-erythritol 4-phosphate cytidylyltransferase